MTDEETFEVTGEFRFCWNCKQPAIVIEGKPQHSITLWIDHAGTRCITPHTDECEYKGKVLPSIPFYDFKD